MSSCFLQQEEILSEEFGEAFSLHDNPSYKERLAIVMLPVHTAGNVYFSRFDPDGREVYTNNRNMGFSLQYVDQPLRVAMSFLLGTSPKLAADTGFRESAEYIRTGMELDNPDFRVNRGRDLIAGQKATLHPPTQPQEQQPSLHPQQEKPDTLKAAKPKDTYTLAIMGTTGAGKTVFLH